MRRSCTVFFFFALKSEQEGMSNSVYSHIRTWQLTVFTNEYFGLRSKGITMDCSVGCLALIPNRKAKSVCNNYLYPMSIRVTFLFRSSCVLRETATAKSRVQMISMSHQLDLSIDCISITQTWQPILHTSLQTRRMFQTVTKGEAKVLLHSYLRQFKEMYSSAWAGVTCMSVKCFNFGLHNPLDHGHPHAR